MSGRVVVLAGGTGGAKLCRGLLDVLAPGELTVIANTGDDTEIYGAHVSPDPDLVSFWLADLIDERGWGLKDDTFQVMDGLRSLGHDVYFNLGDRDLAIGIERARLLAEGVRLTEAHERICQRLGVPGRVLPMSDHPVRTRIMSGGRWWGFQEFMIRAGGRGPVQDVDFRGAPVAPPSAEVLAAIAEAEVILIGPSNPVISIAPILALPGLRDAVRRAPAPVVAVSPVVGGEIVKGPTEAFLSWAGTALSSDGIAELYAGLIDGLVADERVAGLPVLETDVLMASPEARRRVADQTLSFAVALGGAR